MTDFPQERMDGEDFVELAYEILGKFQVSRYEDDLLEIRANYNGLDLEITRKAQDVDASDPRVGHLRVSNPTTMVMDGDIIRHHGEYTYLVPRMKELVK